jgi:predicted Zn-dependent protease
MHRVRMCALVCSLVVALCSQARSQGVDFYTVNEDIRMGQEMSMTLARQLLIVHEAKLDDYVTELGENLAKRIPSPFAYSWTIYEDRKTSSRQPPFMVMPIDGLSGQPTECIALPGGPILVPMSLLANARSEAEFAFLVAHVIAHVAMRHATRLATRQQIVHQVSGGQTEILPSMVFARQFERQADVAAIVAMADAGYDPRTVIPYLGSRRSGVIEKTAGRLPTQGYSASTGKFNEVKALAAAIR